MPEAGLELALRGDAQLGEGLQWQAGRWWWTDIEGARLHAWAPGQAAAQSWVLPDRLGCFAHTRSGRLLLGLAKRLAFATLGDAPQLERVDSLAPVDAAEPRTRVNDGRTDRRGYFVFGTMNEHAAERRTIGSFYQYSRRHGLRRLPLPAVAIANSICFSPDGATMYFADTVTGAIQRCDYDAESAQVANLRPFARVDDGRGWPDGSVIDREGCLWNAQWGAGRVRRYAPDGRAIADYLAPAAHSSSPALGGPDGDWLMATTARSELSREALAAQPLSGSLFGLKLPTALALADALFDDDEVSA
ncbi:MAG: SMP-30/gluconolactonase/LRE family protein [Pelomonas sp.]|nr:SMP-30/gluconolactonase/LRE family protein [Roseateles sp.]